MPLIKIARGITEEKTPRKRRSGGRKSKRRTAPKDFEEKEKPKQEVEKAEAGREEEAVSQKEKEESRVAVERKEGREEKPEESEVAGVREEKKEEKKYSFEERLRLLDRGFWEKFVETYKFSDNIFETLRKRKIEWEPCDSCSVGIYGDQLVVQSKHSGKIRIITDKPLEVLRDLAKDDLWEEDLSLYGLYAIVKDKRLKSIMKEILNITAGTSFELIPRKDKIVIRGIDDSRVLYFEFEFPNDLVEKKYVKYLEQSSTIGDYIKPELFETSWRIRMDENLAGFLRKLADFDVVFDPKNKKIGIAGIEGKFIVDSSFEGEGKGTAVHSDYLKKVLNFLRNGKIVVGSDEKRVLVVNGEAGDIKARFLVAPRVLDEEELVVELPKTGMKGVGRIEYYAGMGDALYFRDAVFFGKDLNNKSFREIRGVFFSKDAFTKKPILISPPSDAIDLKGTVKTGEDSLVVEGELYAGKYRVKGAYYKRRYYTENIEESTRDLSDSIDDIKKELTTQKVVGEVSSKLLTGTTKYLEIENGEIVLKTRDKKDVLGKIDSDANSFILYTLKQASIKKLVGAKKLPKKIPIIRTESGLTLAKIEGEKGTLYLQVELY